MPKTYISIAKVRQALADYIYSEGCNCCQDVEAHREHRVVLARLLNVPAHEKQQDYHDFSPFRTKEQEHEQE